MQDPTLIDDLELRDSALDRTQPAFCTHVSRGSRVGESTLADAEPDHVPHGPLGIAPFQGPRGLHRDDIEAV